MKPTIHIHINAPVVKTRDMQKPYVSSTKEGWEVLGNKGQLVKSFPTLAAAKGEVDKLAAKNIRAKVNQEVDEATEKMYFVVVRL